MTTSDAPGALSPLKRAFIALEQAETRLAAVEQAAREPIAVIGLGCRVPGADDPAAFWRLLESGGDAVLPVPKERWDAAAYFDPDPDRPGHIAAERAGFLHRPVDRFDAGLFGIAPREAQTMDPQQRLLLEVSWEALEHAGQAPDRLERSMTGVYFGMCSSDYAYLELKTQDPNLLDPHFTSGIAHSIGSGRLSYLLGLQGPSLTIDTACSSSLVAVHLACQALRTGDCRMALAGGVNLMLAPDIYIALSRARMLSPDGRCKTFDAAADGFARGEGCGVVVLKRLSDAEADGDRVLAVVLGSAVNQDGPSGSLTAPNGPAQEAVIRQALARSGVTPKQVGVIEAHGTGTQLGDPLEVQALGSVFGEGRDPKHPLALASVKTNIGHLEGAAGVVGLIKLVLSVAHEKVPGHLHFKNPSPHIPWADLPFRVPTALTPWEPIDGRRIGGVSSFGFSGTNAHVVVAQAPTRTTEAAKTSASTAHLLVLSARDEKALSELAAGYEAALAGKSESELRDVCFTASVGRSRFSHRAAVVAKSVDEMRARLSSLAQGTPAEGVSVARLSPRDPPRVAFLYTGQGAQYAGMTRGLYAEFPVFRDALDRCAALLAARLARPLLEVLFPAEGASSPIDETAYTQPALFSVQYALTELWRSFGVSPSAVLGHSIGEYAALCAAGVLGLEDAIRLVAERGRLMQSLPEGGAMAAIFAPEARVARAIEPYKQRVSIAAANAPEQTVISGAAAEVDKVSRALAAEGVRVQALTVSHAFHSPLVEPILDAFQREAASVTFSAPRLPVISDLTGRLAEPAQLKDPTTWRKHVREAVRFGDGLAALSALHPDIVIEIGPHPTLLAFAKAVYADKGPSLVPSLRKNRPDTEQLSEAFASLFLAGAEIDFRAFARGREGKIVDLPTYPFQRERFWFRAKPAATASSGLPTGHPLLGNRLRTAGTETIYEAAIGADTPAFVRDHQVQGRVVLPATAYLETLIAAAQRSFGAESAAVQDVVVQEAMLLEDDGSPRTAQIVCGPATDGAVPVQFKSAAPDGDPEQWTTHVTARLARGTPAQSAAPGLEEARARCTRTMTSEEHYAGFAERGILFGPRFRVVQKLWCGELEAVGSIALGDEMAREASNYRMHPVLLDGCLQLLVAALPHERKDTLYLPIGIGAYTFHRSPGTRCSAHVAVRPGGTEARRADLRVFDEQGGAVVELSDVQLKRVSRDALARIGERWLEEALYEVVYRPAPGDTAAAAIGLSLEQLASAGTAALPGLRKAASLDEYDAFLPRLENLCADYTVHALAKLGWSPKVGETVQPAALAERLRVAPRHGRLFQRLLSILAEARWLEAGPSGFTVARPLTGVDPVRDLARISAECPLGEAELEMTGRTGNEFAEALRGEREPMQLLFPGGSLATAERLYRDGPTAKLYNGLIAEALSALASARPAGRPLRILEIGAGTGGTTSHVLPRLPKEGVEYTYTDVGPLFVARARERFAAYPFLKFAVLDLERDPEAQGFATGAYDVVIASNVIHATARLRVTLERVRKVLARGGILVMLEVTSPLRWFDLTVGLTEGWWAFQDGDLRTDYATLPRDKWLKLLSEAGFDGVTALPEGTSHAGSLGRQSILMARAGGKGAGSFVLFADRTGLGTELAARLRARGDQVTLVQPGKAFDLSGDSAVIDPASAADYERLFAELRAAARSPARVVHLLSLDDAPWENISSEDLSAAEQQSAVSAVLLAQALLGESPPPPRLFVVTRGGQQASDRDKLLEPAQALAWGVGKAVRREHPELGFTCIDVEHADSGAVEALIAELDAAPTEPEIALRGQERRVPRLVRSRVARERAPEKRPPSYRLVPTTKGSLDAFTTEPWERRAPGPGEVEVQVDATGLNFKDVLNVLGMYPGDPGPLGGECAGTVVAVGAGVDHVAAGDEVIAVAGGSFGSHVLARSELVQRRPEGMSAEEGASLPIAFLTAEFCLGHLAKMKAGDRVLIHAAAGGVGMAAVRLAQRAGAVVIATAGAPWKQRMLRSLGVEHVFDSRSASFADGIEKLTGSRGVDVVLNSLSGDLIDATFRVVAKGGRFIEIGKRGIKDAAWVAALGRNIDYHIVDWGVTAAEEPALIGSMFARLMDEFRSGTLASLPRHAFSLEDATRAFRLMAQARHAGRIVVRHGPMPAPRVRRDGSYLVTGGLNGLGLLVGRWLVERGAGRVVLIGRRRITGDLAVALDELRARGTSVVAESVDVTDEPSLRVLLERLRREGPPLRGIIHSAGVLDDAAILQQDAGKYARVLGPKVRGAHLLDGLTRGDPLDFFCLFSSIAGVLGSPGQSNHSAANAFLGVLARERSSRGMPALSIDWGAWTEVGAAADRGITERLAAQGIGAVTPAEGLTAFERMLGEPSPQVAVFPVDWRKYVEHATGVVPPFLTEVAGTASSAASTSAKADKGPSPKRVDLREQLQGVPQGRWRPTVAAFVRERALGALGLDASRAVDPATPLGELGLDSLLAVELRNTLSTSLGRSMPATLLFDYPTLDALTDYVVTDVLGLETRAQVAVPAPAVEAPAELVGSIEDLSDEEVERQLAALAGSKS